MVNKTPKPKWFRFSLRFLLIVMVVVGGLLAVWRQVWAPKFRQHAAIAELEKEVKTLVIWETDQSNWLTRQLNQQVVTLVRLEVDRTPVADRHIEQLANFHRLDYLTVVAPDENAELSGLENLDNVSNLLLFDLANSKSLKHVGKMKRLNYLDITFADDAAIQLDALSKAQSLVTLAITTESLDFSNPFGKVGVGTRRVRDDFTPVGELSNLRHLTITSTSVNDEMVAQLFELNSLEQLVLEPITGNPKGFAEAITEAIDYQLDDVPFSTLIEFLEDYSGAIVIVDEGLIDPNEVVSIGSDDKSLEAFFASRGLKLLCLREEFFITTPEDAAKRRPNLAELKRHNPRLQDIRVVYD